MKLFLAFSGEGTTDHRFFPTIIERLIQEFLIEKGITAEFSWITITKRGTSYDNIRRACSEAKDQHIVLFHRDSGNNTWEQTFENHFSQAISSLEEEPDDEFNKTLIPIIPIKETEAWMLVNKMLLREKMETTLSDSQLGLTYKVKNIETITDPKNVIENAILNHSQTLTSKQRRYSVKIGELYDIVASEVSISDLDNLDSFKKLKKSLNDALVTKLD